MALKQLKKEDLGKFLDILKKDYLVVGPVKGKDIARFNEVHDAKDLDLTVHPYYSARKLFLPNNEILFNYKKNKVEVPEENIKTVLMLNPCDANAIVNYDRVFLDEHKDPYYKKRRQNTALFVFECTKPGKNCFCTSLGTDTTHNYDVMFIDKGDRYIANIKTQRGYELTDNDLFTNVMVEMKSGIKCKKQLVLTDDLNKYIGSKDWETESDKCLFCNGCISVCPTCYCYNVKDVANLDLKSGKRVRHWDYCYMESHTKVAGGFVFRGKKPQRFKQRILHKFLYFKEHSGKQLCVGCGRCITVCPKKIDMVEIVNNIK